MVWRKPKDHFNDCYVCVVDLNGFNRHKKNNWSYPDLESARRPVLMAALFKLFYDTAH